MMKFLNYNQQSIKSIFTVFLFSLFTFQSVFGEILKGCITDARTGETLPGASIVVKNSSKGTITDYDGNYELDLPPGRYQLSVSYVSYNTTEVEDVEIASDQMRIINIPLEESSLALGELVVVSMRRLNSEVGMLNTMRTSMSVVSGVSAQQISRTQDRDASEVIKRIPGISLIEDRFIITRGLSQRYNNAWINNSAVPSTESDTRAFSFDIIPSSQIENIIVVKSPQPELLADFSGGFVKVSTKSVPDDNSMQISYGMGVNTQTHFQDFKYNKGSGTDWLGFDNGMRSLAGFVLERMNNDNLSSVTNITKNGFNNNWDIKKMNPYPDQRFSFVINRRFANNKLGLTGAVNYTNSFKTYENMLNSRFGVYNAIADEPVYMNNYTDNQYSHDVRLGAMFNLVYAPSFKNRFEFRNIFNQLAKDRYTEREGYMFLSGYYNQKKYEYVYNSRLTYSGQLAGVHNFSENSNLDWTAGFSYANRNQPDRRIINMEENNIPNDLYNGLFQIDQNEISRDFLKLNEYAYTFASNYKHNIEFDNGFKPTIKAGVYGEYKERDYKNRLFYYRWKERNVEDDFSYGDVVNDILIEDNYSADRLYIYEDTDNRNSYSGENTLLAAYAAANIPLGKLSIYAGLRFEHNKMSLINYTAIKADRTVTHDYPTTDLFPSVNVSYELVENHLLRFAYGKSINRQEFREVSSAVYNDFEMFSSIKGNPDLKPAYIQNFDLRYEFYPTAGELISLGVFYKNFKNPIEWIYRDAGGSYIYSFENAESANNYGIELDVKKNLDFIGMKNFSLTMNGALIKSDVKFSENSLEHDRPMQGQSPYLVNAGLFYQNDNLGLNAGVLYNIIGKRIVGIGRQDTSDGGSINNDIPDMYEMPRNVLDFNVSKKWKSGWELNLAVRDIIAQDVLFKQFPKFYDSNGVLHEREQITRKYKPGTTFILTLRYNF